MGTNVLDLTSDVLEVYSAVARAVREVLMEEYTEQLTEIQVSVATKPRLVEFNAIKRLESVGLHCSVRKEKQKVGTGKTTYTVMAKFPEWTLAERFIVPESESGRPTEQSIEPT